MRCLLLRGLSVLLVLTVATPALAAEKTNGVSTGACESIPPPSPTGGGNRERLEAIRKCNIEVVLKQQQAMMAEMEVVMSQTKAMMAQMKGVTLSERRTPRTSTLTDSNPPSEIPSPYLQMLEQQQQAIVAEMEVMMSQTKAMMAQIKGVTLSERRASRTSTLTDSNPPSEIPSPYLQMLEQQQQAIVAEMEVMISQLKAMMVQMKGVTLSERRASRTSTLTDSNPPSEIPSPYLQMLEQQQQAIIAEMEVMMARMKVMMTQMRRPTPGEPQSPAP